MNKRNIITTFIGIFVAVGLMLKLQFKAENDSNKEYENLIPFTYPYPKGDPEGCCDGLLYGPGFVVLKNDDGSNQDFPFTRTNSSMHTHRPLLDLGAPHIITSVEVSYIVNYAWDMYAPKSLVIKGSLRHEVDTPMEYDTHLSSGLSTLNGRHTVTILTFGWNAVRYIELFKVFPVNKESIVSNIAVYGSRALNHSQSNYQSLGRSLLLSNDASPKCYSETGDVHSKILLNFKNESLPVDFVHASTICTDSEGRLATIEVTHCDNPDLNKETTSCVGKSCDEIDMIIPRQDGVGCEVRVVMMTAVSNGTSVLVAINIIALLCLAFCTCKIFRDKKQSRRLSSSLTVSTASTSNSQSRSTKFPIGQIEATVIALNSDEEEAADNFDDNESPQQYE